jgi:dTDP-4-amino-4,6-dideoxygalactose transaminase
MWLYSMLIDPAITGVDRTGLHVRLSACGIETRPVWAPAHRMPFYQAAPRLGGAVGERLFARGLSLPCSVSLDAARQQHVIEMVMRCLAVGDRVVDGAQPA